MDDKPYPIDYEFSFEDGTCKAFHIALHPETITIVRPESEASPEWTRLDHRQCSCCPLDKTTHPYCPIAVNIVELIEAYKGMASFERCTVRCTTKERTFLKETSVQEGLFSIFEVIMATSNCPVMDFLKPLARFHLPFCTIEETVVRSVSVYLLQQHFEHKRGKIPDLALDKFAECYKNVQAVNEGILMRINDLSKTESSKNAIMVIFSLAQIFSMDIEGSLHSIEYLF